MLTRKKSRKLHKYFVEAKYLNKRDQTLHTIHMTIGFTCQGIALDHKFLKSEIMSCNYDNMKSSLCNGRLVVTNISYLGKMTNVGRNFNRLNKL